jgi:site-specific recombinase XerD
VTDRSLLERFCAEHFAVNGISPPRQRFVRRTLVGFQEHAGRPLEQCDGNDLLAYLTHLSARGMHPNTVRQHAGRIRPFFKPYKRKEIRRFWQQLDERWPLDETGKWTRRWLAGRSPYRRVWPHAVRLQIGAIAHLALHAGMRRDEIFRVELDDVHYDNAYIVVRGAAKGANGAQGIQFREVPVTADARKAIHEWLELRTVILQRFQTPDHGRPWLVLDPRATPNSKLPSSPAAPMRHRAFEAQLQTVGRWELQRFRHACGTEWLRAGMELEKVSKLLGHASIVQTLGYAEVAHEDVHRSAAKHEAAFIRAVGTRGLTNHNPR